MDKKSTKKQEPEKSQGISARDRIKKQHEIVRKIEYFEGVIGHIDKMLASGEEPPSDNLTVPDPYVCLFLLDSLKFTFPSKYETGQTGFAYDKNYPFVLALEGIRDRFASRVVELDAQLERLN